MDSFLTEYHHLRPDTYAWKIKATAVELGALPGVKAKQVADILDIHPIMLYRWKKEYREGAIMKKVNKGSLNSETLSELQRLKTIEKAHKRLCKKRGRYLSGLA